MATFLGIVLDAKLNWSAHTEAIKTRYMKRLNAVRAISEARGERTKSNLLQVYRATIRPLLDYSCEAIDMKCKHITEVFNQDPVSSTKDQLWWHEGNERNPLDLRHQKLMANHALRSTATKNMPLKNKYFVLMAGSSDAPLQAEETR